MSLNRTSGGLRNIDLITFSLYLGLVSIGWLMVYTVGYGEGYPADVFKYLATQSGKQTIWIGISIVAFAVIMLLDWKFWTTFAYPIYTVGLFFLVAVLIFGTRTNGATAWFSFGGFSFQPSELAKFGTLLAVSAFLSYYSTSLKQFKSQIIAIGLIFTPMVLILMQPDAGSAFVFLSFLILFYREGLSPTVYLVGAFSAILLILGLIIPTEQISLTLLLLGVGALFFQFKPLSYWVAGAIALAVGAFFLAKEGAWWISLGAGSLAFVTAGWFVYRRRKARLVFLLSAAILVGSGLAFAANYAFNSVLKPHQQDRINVWLRPERCSEKGSLYNVTQSKMAISSGGFEGKGFLNGTMTRLNYVPEQSTDFIFCTIGEEQGFVGVFGVVTLFLLLLIRLTVLAERQRSTFSRHYAYGLAGILFIHFFINIGMTMGLLPIIGIPLPFISKGGSSLLGFTTMIAVMLKLDSHRYQI